MKDENSSAEINPDDYVLRRRYMFYYTIKTISLSFFLLLDPGVHITEFTIFLNSYSTIVILISFVRYLFPRFDNRYSAAV